MTVDEMRTRLIAMLAACDDVASVGPVEDESGAFGVEMSDGQEFFVTIDDDA